MEETWPTISQKHTRAVIGGIPKMIRESGECAAWQTHRATAIAEAPSRTPHDLLALRLWTVARRMDSAATSQGPYTVNGHHCARRIGSTEEAVARSCA